MACLVVPQEEVEALYGYAGFWTYPCKMCANITLAVQLHGRVSM